MTMLEVPQETCDLRMWHERPCRTSWGNKSCWWAATWECITICGCVRSMVTPMYNPSYTPGCSRRPHPRWIFRICALPSLSMTSNLAAVFGIAATLATSWCHVGQSNCNWSQCSSKTMRETPLLLQKLEASLASELHSAAGHLVVSLWRCRRTRRWGAGDFSSHWIWRWVHHENWWFHHT